MIRPHLWNAILLLCLAGCLGGTAPYGSSGTGGMEGAPAILPFPQSMQITGGTVALPETLSCHLSDASLQPLIPIVSYEYAMRTGGRIVAADDPAATCRFILDPSLAEEAYALQTGPGVTIRGGSYRAVAMGTVSLMQALRRGPGGAVVPALAIEDRPDSRYRSLMIDVARQWHDVSTLKQLVLLCRWYKINYMQLHLTDDQSFTFPTESYPALPTPGRHYTKEELRELVIFARDRGVTLVPELEVPGHASRFIEAMPNVFGLRDWQQNTSSINMGREEMYVALDRIVGEVAEVFQTSPYIHMGGDETNLDNFIEDLDVQYYMREHGLSSVQELYRHFLVRMNDIIRSHGKQAIVWEGFRREGEIEIPRNILVMAWESVYQLPQDLLTDGYTVINASWVPLYVVNDKKWPVAEIYRWNLWRWENWVEWMPSYTPIQLDSTAQVIGASMEAWDQPQHMELPSLRQRVAAMSERIWNGTVEPEQPLSTFLDALANTDAAFQEIITPITIQTEGQRYPGLEEGHSGEEYWFGDALTLTLSTAPGQTIYYSLDGTPPTPEDVPYTGPVTVRETTPFRARAFTPEGEPVGYDVWRGYAFRPIDAEITGSFADPLDRLWEKMDQRPVFTGTLTLTLSSGRPGTIRYTMDGSDPTASSTPYAGPITIAETADVKAQLFDAEGRPVGPVWTGRYLKGE